MKNPFRYRPTDSDVYIPMPESAPETESQEPPALTGALDENIAALCKLLHCPPNEDVIIRRFAAGKNNAALILMEGMVSRDEVARTILEPLLRDDQLPRVPDQMLISHITTHTLSPVSLIVHDNFAQAYKDILNGSCALLLDRVKGIVCVDIRMYEKRNVDKTQVENVIMGPHEAFTENLRTSITQVRRLIRAGSLVTEFFEVGNEAPTSVALLYLDGIVNAGLVDEARRRLSGINYDFAPGSGYIQHLIEDSPSSIAPQMLQTERPDRTAFFLMEGQIAILCDGAPFALAAPATFWHIMHTPDDTFMRWSNGMFIRLIRFTGLLLSLLLPSLYLATIQYHTEILPTELLVSIASANANVPFPMLLEVLLMELSFDLIQEAGTRVPGTLGSALGIIGAIILGQAAVAASIVSPILVIIAAVTGLGNFATSDYSFSVSVRALRLIYIVCAALFGYLGVSMCLFLTMVFAGSLSSFGVPWLSPFAPKSTANKDVLIPEQFWKMRRRPAFLRPRDAARANSGRTRVWDRPEKKP